MTCPMVPLTPDMTPANRRKLFIFGGGYLATCVARAAVARGMTVTLTSRDPARRTALAAEGFGAIDPADPEALTRAASAACAILVTAPPDAKGCPALRAFGGLRAHDAWPDWIGYISSTSVYGDRAGGWTFEDDPLHAATVEGARRIRAERDWLDSAQGMGLTVQIFRLPAFYGPGRNPIERIRSGQARLVRNPGQVFNRIHVDDVVAALFASMARPHPGRIYNLADDAPSPADRVLEWAARLMDVPSPPEVGLDEPSVSEAMRRFYLDSKRISNARAKAELGWRLRYPDYRAGLQALLHHA